MIKCDGCRVVMSGTGVELLQDFVNVTKGVRSTLSGEIGEERADEIITLCGRYAYAETESEEIMYAERLCEVIAGIEKKTGS